MSLIPSSGVPARAWGLAVLAVGVAVAALLVFDQRADPSPALRYDTAALPGTPPGALRFHETGQVLLKVPGACALAVAPRGDLYVAAPGALVLCDRDGAETRRYPLEGSPAAVAVGPDGTVAVAFPDRLQLGDPAAGPLRASDPLEGDALITAVAVAADAVYAADAGNRVVVRFDREGHVTGRIGVKDPARDIPGFVVPSPHFDLGFDPDGALWVVNPGQHGLEQYRPDGSLVTSWYRPGLEVEGFCGCCNPTHIAFRADGSLLTAEKGVVRVKRYTPDWRFAAVVAGPEAFEESNARAAALGLDTVILDLAVDARGRVLVLDGGANAIRIFEERKSAS